MDSDEYSVKTRCNFRGIQIRLNYVQHLYPRIERLGYYSWRRHVKEIISDYIEYLKYDIPKCGLTFYKMELQLKKYEKMEKVSLLELAVWKASCLSFDGSGNFFTMQDILDQGALDNSFDPAAYKAQRRFSSSSVQVIVALVLEFIK